MELRDYKEYARKVAYEMLHMGTTNDGQDTSPALSIKNDHRIDYTGMMRHVGDNGEEEFLRSYIHLWQPMEGVMGVDRAKICIDVVRGMQSFRASHLFDIEVAEVDEIIESLQTEINLSL